MARASAIAAVLLGCLALAAAGRTHPAKEFVDKKSSNDGKKWGVLIAGSASWGNYRHQADIYHAYQVLHRGGLADENIIVLHTDDIANNPANPKRGTVINIPGGDDVYHDVPKDYTGDDVNAKVFLAVLAGDKSGVAGTTGSQKVLDPAPEDDVFIYFADHGGPGLLGMPKPPYLYANDLIATLKEVGAKASYKQMTIYIEACESGSIFEGLLPEDINIYATTAANAHESSWGYYCPGQKIPAPPGWNTCLGDLYSIAFLEDSDVSDLTKETLHAQYLSVKNRTSQGGTYAQGSHVMQYGDKTIDSEVVATFLGEGNTGGNTPLNRFAEIMEGYDTDLKVSQRDAELVPLWQGFLHASEEEKPAAQAALTKELAARTELDRAVTAAAKASLNGINSLLSAEDLLSNVRAEGKALVDDWDCFKGMVEGWGEACGYISQYGMKHGRTFANLCNAGVSPATFVTAAKSECKQGGVRIQ